MARAAGPRKARGGAQRNYQRTAGKDPAAEKMQREPLRQGLCALRPWLLASSLVSSLPVLLLPSTATATTVALAREQSATCYPDYAVAAAAERGASAAQRRTPHTLARHD